MLLLATALGCQPKGPDLGEIERLNGEAGNVGQLNDRAMQCAVGGRESAIVARLGGEAQSAKAFERCARSNAFTYA